MEYLYHRVPKNMSGTILYPLNTLKETHLEIYNEHVKKYKGREKLLSNEIPPLHCLWNDVLHFTAVTPKELKDKLAKAGISYELSFFKVPVSFVEGENSIAFLYGKNLGAISDVKQYEPFDPNKMDIYGTIPKETVEYYKQKKAEGVRPLLYHLVPHILYKGNIETKDLKTVII